MIESTRRYDQLNLDENSPSKDPSIFVRKSRSIRWKIIHGIISMFGGIFLTGGSSMYFSVLIHRYSIAASLGGWLLTMGSFCLLLGDLQEYFTYSNHCLSLSKNENISILSINDQFDDSECIVIVENERRSDRWNCLLSALGSGCYLIGSMLLIPFFHRYVIMGNWLIIIGSILIFISSLWKIFSLKNRILLLTNILIGLGGLFYLFGIVFLLFKLDENLSASICVLGGSSFLISSLFLQYNYFLQRH